jgi:hypothetical protein
MICIRAEETHREVEMSWGRAMHEPFLTYLVDGSPRSVGGFSVRREGRVIADKECVIVTRINQASANNR